MGISKAADQAGFTTAKTCTKKGGDKALYPIPLHRRNQKNSLMFAWKRGERDTKNFMTPPLLYA